METRAPERQLLTTAQVAERLSLKESAIRAWLLARRLSCVRIGRRAVRIPASDVERVIAEGAMTRNSRRKLPPRSDAGNGEFFATLYGVHTRFNHSRQRWLLFSDHCWKTDSDGELMRMAKRAVRYRLMRSANIGDDDKRQEEAKWALSSESRARLEAMLNLARSENPIADDGSGWDADGWLLGVANGVVEVRTGVLRSGVANDRITLHSDIPFDSSAECPRWVRFLDEVFDGNPELIAYVHRAVGYSLTGQTSEQCFFCCYGEGANGKSAFLKAIGHVLGTYACNLLFSAFELNARSAISNDAATLPGKRFVTAIEIDESGRLNEARIRALTGGDILTARLLYREFFHFKPDGKFWLAFNHRPVVTDASHGFWRRVHIIPFLRQFDPHADPHLEETLTAGAPGILAWAVRSCLEWQRVGDLNLPVIVREATQTYREDSDPLQDFIADVCIVHLNAVISVAGLCEHYVNWVLQSGGTQESLGRPAFNRRMEAKGFRNARIGHNRNWTWLGICRRVDAEGQGISSIADMRADADVQLQ
jgi:putative DNA primase/helicase